MFKSSITKFLIASLGVLMVGLFVATLILAVYAWTNYALAGRIARLTRTDDTLFNALLTVRAQVPKISTSLFSRDDPAAVIDSRAARRVGNGDQRAAGVARHRHPQSR